MKGKLSAPLAEQVDPDSLLKSPVNQPITLVSRYYSAANEIGYWRKWHELNRWMMELAKSKLPPGSTEIYSSGGSGSGSCTILLTPDDLQCLKLEMLFGDIVQSRREYSSWSEAGKAEFTETALGAVDRAIRVCRHGRSLVYYLASW